MNNSKQYKQTMKEGKAKKGSDMGKNFGKSPKGKEGSKKSFKNLKDRE